MKIRSQEDLAEALGASNSTEEGISHRVYKDTDCGAWVKLLEPGMDEVGKRKETWTALINPSIVGPRVVKVRKNGCRSIDPLEAPQYVKDYLQLTKDRGIEGEKNFNEFVDRLHLSPDAVENMVPKGIGIRVIFHVDAPVFKKHGGGIRIGSIVEGTDAEVTPVELLYPFTKDDLDKAIERVEIEASHIWDETHGCDDCGMDGAINPNCESCHGQGTIL
jgi:hypothetical protein